SHQGVPTDPGAKADLGVPHVPARGAMRGRAYSLPEVPTVDLVDVSTDRRHVGTGHGRDEPTEMFEVRRCQLEGVVGVLPGGEQPFEGPGPDLSQMSGHTHSPLGAGCHRRERGSGNHASHTPEWHPRRLDGAARHRLRRLGWGPWAIPPVGRIRCAPSLLEPSRQPPRGLTQVANSTVCKAGGWRFEYSRPCQPNNRGT